MLGQRTITHLGGQSWSLKWVGFNIGKLLGFLIQTDDDGNHILALPEFMNVEKDVKFNTKEIQHCELVFSQRITQGYRGLLTHVHNAGWKNKNPVAWIGAIVTEKCRVNHGNQHVALQALTANQRAQLVAQEAQLVAAVSNGRTCRTGTSAGG